MAGCQGAETERLQVQEQPGLKRVDSGREIGRTHSHPTRHAEVDGIRLVKAPMVTLVFPKWQGRLSYAISSHVGLEAIETFLASPACIFPRDCGIHQDAVPWGST